MEANEQMKREEMITELQEYCNDKATCIDCPMSVFRDRCNIFGALSSKELEERIDLIEKEKDKRIIAEQLQCAAENLKSDISQTAKDDYGKEQLTLVPRRIIHDICAIRMYGNQKYPDGGPDNWKKVEKERYRDAAYRHFLAYLDDPQGRDKESGFPHLWHLACNIAFLCEFEDGEVK